MNVIVVDDERMPLENLMRTVEGTLTGATIKGFMKPREALDFVSSSLQKGFDKPDLAFLDIEMGGMNGLQLAKMLKEVHDKINIVFTTGYSEYALDAHAMYASGYLMKPISAEAVTQAVNNLRFPVESLKNHRIRIQTFGNFEVFADNRPLKFMRVKTKEMLAYLIMRKGTMCGNNEIIATIWEDKPNTAALQNQYRHLVLDLTKTLRNINAEEIILKQRGALAIIPDRISCDLYDFLAADTDAVNDYTGEFMAQYSWAEFTNAYLDKMVKSIS